MMCSAHCLDLITVLQKFTFTTALTISKKGGPLTALWFKSASHSKSQVCILIRYHTHTHTHTHTWREVGICRGSTTDTPQSKRTLAKTSRFAFGQFDLKGTINSKQMFMHPLQIWTHPLGICKISKKNTETNLLTNVWYATTSTCCLCWPTMIGN